MTRHFYLSVIRVRRAAKRAWVTLSEAIALTLMACVD
jgi:hypothetical protein